MSSPPGVPGPGPDVSLDKLSSFMSSLSLAGQEEKGQLLKDILPVLEHIDVQTDKRTWRASVDQTNLNLLFDCFNTSSEGDMGAAAEVLHRLTNIVSPGLFLNNYCPAVSRCLEHPEASVKRANLKVLQHCAKHPDTQADLAQQTGLLLLCLQCLSDSELSVSQAATEVFVLLSTPADDISEPAASPLLSQPEVVRRLQALAADHSELIRLRVAELVVSIGKMSALNFSLAAQHGFFNMLCNEVRTDDVLVQLNALELISELSGAKDGLDFLEGIDFLREMDAMLSQIQSSPTGQLVLPGFIKLFGAIAYGSGAGNVDVFEKYANFKPMLDSILQSTDAPAEQQTLVLQTYSLICRRTDKKLALFSRRDDHMLAFMRQLRRLVRDGATEHRVDGLKVLADLVTLHEEEADGSMATRREELRVNQRCFDSVFSEDTHPLELLTRFAKQAISEVSEAAHAVLVRLARQEWALALFQSSPGFVEFLLDRSVSATGQDVARMKYETLHLAAGHAHAENIFRQENLDKMRAYLKEGVFHATSEMQVAVEGM